MDGDTKGRTATSVTRRCKAVRTFCTSASRDSGDSLTWDLGDAEADADSTFASGTTRTAWEAHAHESQSRYAVAGS